MIGCTVQKLVIVAVSSRLPVGFSGFVVIICTGQLREVTQTLDAGSITSRRLAHVSNGLSDVLSVSEDGL
jgi:hypothetical protein